MKIFNKLWPYFLRRVARSHGFVDPIALMARLGRFAQPSEVGFPVEILRMGILLQARGFINSQAIQHNLDWIWPYWVARQFDPRSISFIPRAFSLTHINLTHRNWTAVGLPGFDEMPLVDPRGLVTPFYDGFSIDAWIIHKQTQDLIPAYCDQAQQKLSFTQGLSVETATQSEDKQINICTEVVDEGNGPVCAIIIRAQASVSDSYLVVSLRPNNPEGVSFIHEIKGLKDNRGWLVDRRRRILFSAPPDIQKFSRYVQGDVYHKLFDGTTETNGIKCTVGMATGAALYRMDQDIPYTISVHVPLSSKSKVSLPPRVSSSQQWGKTLETGSALSIDHTHFQYLYDAAVRTLVLMTGEDIYPGPYTYKHFWFRDASIMLSAILKAGLHERALRMLELFLTRQKKDGYFSSQDGEWDSNGQVIWALYQYCAMTGKKPQSSWNQPLIKALEWIIKKRCHQDNSPHGGLLPAGFSAEHFGPNDYYYWDDFWSFEGLRRGADLLEALDQKMQAFRCRVEAQDLMRCIEQSLLKAEARLHSKAMPSSPYRRLDSASIGSLVASYPLQVWLKDDPRVTETSEFILKNCLLQNGFYHDMSHSGINPYLTLYVAQVLLRQEDSRYYRIMQSIADLASSTGQWPEAIHPQTKGGCMGDGQHAWSAAEWVIMMRDCFIREEDHDKTLILCCGVDVSWYQNQSASFSDALTHYGKVSVAVQLFEHSVEVSWKGEWFSASPRIIAALPGFEPKEASEGESRLEFALSEKRV